MKYYSKRVGKFFLRLPELTEKYQRTEQVIWVTEDWAITSNDAEHLLGIPKKTFRLWVQGKQTPHPHTLELLVMIKYGLVDADGWRGCQFTDDGHMILPDGRTYHRHQIEQQDWSKQLDKQLINNYELQINALKDELDALANELHRLHDVYQTPETSNVIEFTSRKKGA